MLTEIITPNDLQLFKIDLIECIKQIMIEANGQPAKKWMKSYEVRKILKISTGTLQNMRLNGTLPFTKIGGVIYYDYADIQQMLQDNKQSAAVANPAR